MTTTKTTNFELPIPPLGSLGTADGYGTLMQTADDNLKNSIGVMVSATNSLDAILAAGPAAGTTIIIPSGLSATYRTLNNNRTLPIGVILKPMAGSPVVIGSGKTFTISGKIEAGVYPIFSYADATSAIVFKYSSTFTWYPEWWGAVGDGATEDTTAFQRCFTCLYGADTIDGTRFPSAVILGNPGATYLLETVHIYNNGGKSLFDLQGAYCTQKTTNDLFYIHTSGAGFTIQNGRLVSSSGGTNKTGKAIRVRDTNFHAEGNLEINGFDKGISWESVLYSTIAPNVFIGGANYNLYVNDEACAAANWASGWTPIYMGLNVVKPSNWAPTTAYVVGDVRRPTDESKQFMFEVTSKSGTGTSAGSEPAWDYTPGNTTTDNAGGNQVVWTCRNSLAYNATTITGATGATEPHWPVTASGTVVDNNVTWTAFTTSECNFNKASGRFSTNYIASVYAANGQVLEFDHISHEGNYSRIYHLVDCKDVLISNTYTEGANSDNTSEYSILLDNCWNVKFGPGNYTATGGGSEISPSMFRFINTCINIDIADNSLYWPNSAVPQGLYSTDGTGRGIVFHNNAFYSTLTTQDPNPIAKFYDNSFVGASGGCIIQPVACGRPITPDHPNCGIATMTFSGTYSNATPTMDSTNSFNGRHSVKFAWSGTSVSAENLYNFNDTGDVTVGSTQYSVVTFAFKADAAQTITVIMNDISISDIPVAGDAVWRQMSILSYGIKSQPFKITSADATSGKNFWYADLNCYRVATYQEATMLMGRTGREPVGYITTYDPASMNTMTGTNSGGITCAGALFGDSVEVVAPYDLQGVTATGYVSANNTVTICLFNGTAGTINLASGDWIIKVKR